MESYDNLVKKWAPVLEAAGSIRDSQDSHRRSVTAVVLESKAIHKSSN